MVHMNYTDDVEKVTKATNWAAIAVDVCTTNVTAVY